VSWKVAVLAFARRAKRPENCGLECRSNGGERGPVTEAMILRLETARPPSSAMRTTICAFAGRLDAGSLSRD